jgi:hypothetical protein
MAAVPWPCLGYFIIRLQIPPVLSRDNRFARECPVLFVTEYEHDAQPSDRRRNKSWPAVFGALSTRSGDSPESENVSTIAKRTLKRHAHDLAYQGPSYDESFPSWSSHQSENSHGIIVPQYLMGQDRMLETQESPHTRAPLEAQLKDNPTREASWANSNGVAWDTCCVESIHNVRSMIVASMPRRWRS